MDNYLMNKEFLRRIDEDNNKILWAKIIALNLDEEPIEEITGRIKEGGSISVDGTSSLRRSCSFTLVAQDLTLHNYYWGLNTKFQVFIGLTNNIDKKYPDIVWFNQGVYVITSFNVSKNNTSFDISIQGKDKMCLLNGEVGGTINAPTDFGKIEETDKEGNITITNLPIKEIIWEAVHEYGHELWQNIIIEDLDDYGVELLDYKGKKPLYMFIQTDTNELYNLTFEATKKVYLPGGATKKLQDFSNTELDQRNHLDVEITQQPLKFYLTLEDAEAMKEVGYTLMKIEYGDTPGYRLTNITYPGELIANPGESLTSVLDKIVKMLGIFEYFYDVDGRFIFRKKRIYIDLPWNGILSNKSIDVRREDPIFYSFVNGQLITTFTNTPDLNNLKNDYSIWGRRVTAAGAEIPIHYRYAIDKKPYYYKNYDGKIYTTDDDISKETTNWREIIYQMALDYRKHNHDDDFLIKIIQNNTREDGPVYPTGYTGYEPYYVDMEGFWRQLYNPNFENDDPTLGGDGFRYDEVYVEEVSKELEKEKPSINFFMNNIEIYKKGGQISPENCFLVYVPEEEDSHLLTNQYIEKFISSSYCDPLIVSTTQVFYELINQQYVVIEPEKLAGKNRSYLYIKDDKGIYLRWVDYCLTTANTKIYYLNNKKYIPIKKGMMDINGVNIAYHPKEDPTKIIYIDALTYREKRIKENTGEIEYLYGSRDLYYYTKYYNYYRKNEPNVPKEQWYWNKNVVENPELLNFWIDFMSVYGEMGKYAVSTIGTRAKVVNENTIKSIYFRETPNIVFFNREEGNEVWNDYNRKSGYVYAQLPSSLFGLFNISSKGKSTKTVLDENLYKHTYCTEVINLNTIPIYYFKPNVRIYVQDKDSKIDGEYIVNRFTYNLGLNGTMSISANKVTNSII